MSFKRTETESTNGPKALGSIVALLVLFLSSFGALSSARAQEEARRIQFQELSQRLNEKDPSVESTVFDLYLSDKFKGSLLVSYTESWFEIDEPSEVLEQLPELKKGADEILPLVSGRIEKTRTIEGVGTVYYDLGTFRIVLQLGAEYLKGKGLDLTKRMLAPSSGLSFNQALGIATSLQDDSSSQSAFSHRSFGSYGRFFTRVDGAAVQNRPYEITEATGGGIIGNYQLRGGLLQMRGQAFSPSLQFAGMQFETAEQIFLDDELARGSPLQIFVPSRSTVEFYRDGRLLAVMVLDYGLQEVNTSAFPQGSYDVDIVIKESSGQVTQDRRFFTKAGFLASRAHPVLSLSAGVIRDKLDILATPLAQAAVRYRAFDFMDLGTSVSGTDENIITSADFNGLFRNLRFGAGGAVAQDNSKGVQGSLGLTVWNTALSGRVARTYGTDASLSLVPTPSPTGVEVIPLAPEVRRELSIEPQEVNSATIYKNFGRVDGRFVLERNKVRDSPARYSNGPTLDWRLLDSTLQSVVLRGSYLATERGMTKSLQLLFRRRITPALSLSSQLLQRWQDADNESLILVGVSYDSLSGRSGTGSKLRSTLEARRQDQDSGKKDTQTVSLDADVTSQYLRSTAFARGINQNSGFSKSLGINAESSFLISDKGDLSIGHPVQSDAALVAEVDGEDFPDDAKFEVLVNGQVRDLVRPGERAVIGLSPYQTYKANIRPSEGSAIVDYDTSTVPFSLFPGNVFKHVWKVERTFIILGRIVDETGAPIPSERVRGTNEYCFTEEDGTFQAEITGKTTLYIDSKRVKCSLDFKLETKPEYYLDVGDIVCRQESLEEPQ